MNSLIPIRNNAHLLVRTIKLNHDGPNIPFLGWAYHCGSFDNSNPVAFWPCMFDFEVTEAHVTERANCPPIKYATAMEPSGVRGKY